MAQAKPEPAFPVGFDEDALAVDEGACLPSAQTINLVGMGPTSYTRFRRQLDVDAELVAELYTVRGRAETYSVVLLALDEGDKWATVRVFDNEHGVAHIHRYTRLRGKQDAERVNAATPSEGFNMALEWAENGYREMIETWRRS